MTHVAPAPDRTPWNPPPLATCFSLHRISVGTDGKRTTEACTAVDERGVIVRHHPCPMPLELIFPTWGSGVYTATYHVAGKQGLAGKASFTLNNPLFPTQPAHADFREDTEEPDASEEEDGEEWADEDEEEDSEAAELRAENARLVRALEAARAPKGPYASSRAPSRDRQGAASVPRDPGARAGRGPRAPAGLAVPAGMSANDALGFLFWCQNHARSEAREQIDLVRAQGEEARRTEAHRHQLLLDETEARHKRMLEAERQLTARRLAESTPAKRVAELESRLARMEEEPDEEEPETEDDAQTKAIMTAVKQGVAAAIPTVLAYVDTKMRGGGPGAGGLGT